MSLMVAAAVAAAAAVCPSDGPAEVSLARWSWAALLVTLGVLGP